MTEIKYRLLEVSDKGHLQNIVTREMYDYYDRTALASKRYDSVAQAAAAVAENRDIIRHAREVVIVPVVEVK